MPATRSMAFIAWVDTSHGLVAQRYLNFNYLLILRIVAQSCLPELHEHCRRR